MDQTRIGKYIAECRKAKGFTQRSLADKLLVSDKAVSKWERGICLPNIELLVPLSEILGTNVNSLLMPENDNNQPEGESIVDVVRLYNKETKKNICRRVVIILSVLTLLLATVIIPLYGKYSASKYKDEVQAAWIKASESVIELLDFCVLIKKQDYKIDKATHLMLNSLIYKTIDCISDFQDKTKLPKMHDRINAEMGVNSPGITSLFAED